MRLVKQQGGHSVAVYNPDEEEQTRGEMERLVHDNRVNAVCPADYREGGKIDTFVKTIIDKITVDTKLATYLE